MPVNDFKSLVQNSSSFREILRHFGLDMHGGNYATLHSRLKVEGINDSHLYKGAAASRRKGLNGAVNRKKRPLDQILVEHSTYARSHVRRRLIESGLLETRCAICGQEPFWNGRPLTLSLDHINGIPDDNRLQNLRLLCPNCHSQTPNYVGRGQVRPRLHQVVYYCKQCGASVPGKSKSGLCRRCYDMNRRKVERPTTEFLIARIKEVGYRRTGREFGVSDNAIRKWIHGESVVKQPPAL